jgi:hypothetical protein
MAFSTPSTKGERCGVGVLPARRRLIGDDEDVLACGRLAVPAIGQVEQPPSDDVRRHVAVVARHEVGRSLGAAGLAVAARKAPGHVAVAVPVEQRPDLVVVVGDEPVQGDHRTDDRPAHNLVLSLVIFHHTDSTGLYVGRRT